MVVVAVVTNNNTTEIQQQAGWAELSQTDRDRDRDSIWRVSLHQEMV